MFLLQPQRQQHFLHLALDGAVGFEKEVLGKLLRQGRAALRQPPGDQVFRHGAGKADRVDTEMRVESAVLDGDHRLGNMRRHLMQAHCLATGHAAIGDHVSVGGNDLHVRRAVGDFPGGRRRHFGAVIGGDADSGDAAPQRQNERPVDGGAQETEETTAAPTPIPASRARTAVRFAPLALLPPAGLRRWREGTTRSLSPSFRSSLLRRAAGASKVGSILRFFVLRAIRSQTPQPCTHTFHAGTVKGSGLRRS